MASKRRKDEPVVGHMVDATGRLMPAAYAIERLREELRGDPDTLEQLSGVWDLIQKPLYDPKVADAAFRLAADLYTDPRVDDGGRSAKMACLYGLIFFYLTQRPLIVATKDIRPALALFDDLLTLQRGRNPDSKVFEASKGSPDPRILQDFKARVLVAIDMQAENLGRGSREKAHELVMTRVADAARLLGLPKPRKQLWRKRLSKDDVDSWRRDARKRAHQQAHAKTFLRTLGELVDTFRREFRQALLQSGDFEQTLAHFLEPISAENVRAEWAAELYVRSKPEE
jgi:hypothetical protein